MVPDASVCSYSLQKRSYTTTVPVFEGLPLYSRAFGYQICQVLPVATILPKVWENINTKREV